MRERKFEYVKGAVKTNTPWFRPRGSLLNKWKNEFFKIQGVKNYNFWICGGALEEWKTWDTDITINGEIKCYKELENIIISATRLGFKYQQLVDINWVETSPIDTPNIYHALSEYHSRESTISPNGTVWENGYDTVSVISGCCEIFKNGKKLPFGNLAKEVVQISDFLWKRNQKNPSEKQLARIKNGIVYNKEPVLLTLDLDFKKIIK
jgi:hypothetical protein